MGRASGETGASGKDHAGVRTGAIGEDHAGPRTGVSGETGASGSGSAGGADRRNGASVDERGCASSAGRTDEEAGLAPRQWMALAGLTLSAFMLNTSEFMPIGLLTDIASGFGITEAAAGVMITVYAWAVMLLSLPLMIAAGTSIAMIFGMPFIACSVAGMVLALFVLRACAVSFGATSAVFILWGCCATAFNVAFQSEIIHAVEADESAAAMSIFSGPFNFGIGAGSAVGGFVVTDLSVE